MVKRHEITQELRSAIKDSSYSLTKLCRLAGFNVKNTYYKNISINDDHLSKLKKFIDLENVYLRNIGFDNTKNLGKYSASRPIKPIKTSEKLAEFFGIMLGDGHLNHYYLCIAFDKRNKGYIEYVKILARDLFSVELKLRVHSESNKAYLYFNSKMLVQKFVELGLKIGSKKKNNLGIPMWIKKNRRYSMACIRGLIDTDGCILKSKRDKQTYIGFSNYNSQLMSDFKETAKFLGYPFAKANERNTTLYRKAEVVRFINEIKPFKTVGAGAVVQLG